MHEAPSLTMLKRCMAMNAGRRSAVPAMLRRSEGAMIQERDKARFVRTGFPQQPRQISTWVPSSITRLVGTRK